MITDEEALRLIKECDECYVVWATDQNAVVAVHPMPNSATAEDRSKVLASMSSDYNGPTKGRFLVSKDVTLQTLQAEHTETDRIQIRTNIFNSWTKFTVDQLIDVVTERRFCEPMDPFHGSSHIIERLYKIYSRNLTGDSLSRLERFAYSTIVCRDQETAQKDLRCYLAVLQNNPGRLKAFWEQYHCPEIDWSTWRAFTDASGDLPIKDQEIISQLIKVVETPFMFGPRYEAMVALGKIGQSSGQRAVDVIKASIHDSSEHVTAARNRAVAHIQGRNEHWMACGRCNRGYVDGTAYNIPSVGFCEKCLGLAYVPIGAT